MCSAELRDRTSRIDLLRKKYEVLVMTLAPSEDGEEHSQAYYLVKAAQERQQLQRQGDEIDAKIRKGEKEIRALQNTLDMMNGRNQQYRATLLRADPSSADALQKEELDGQVRANIYCSSASGKDLFPVPNVHGDLQNQAARDGGCTRGAADSAIRSG